MFAKLLTANKKNQQGLDRIKFRKEAKHDRNQNYPVRNGDVSGRFDGGQRRRFKDASEALIGWLRHRL